MLAVGVGLAGGLEAATPITRMTRGQVSFEADILPILQSNCLPCHNRNTAKAGLNMESPATLLQGGDSGPAIVAKRGERSLLLRLASHAAEPFMPPKGNKANAADLTPDELGLIKLWIDQGAKAGAVQERPIEWRPIAASYRGIGAVALSPDGRLVACGRANELLVYDLATLTPAVCHAKGQPIRDLIGAVAFSPDGMLLAAGGYREVQLWRRVARKVRRLAQAEGRRRDHPDPPRTTSESLSTNGLRIELESAQRVRVVRVGGTEIIRTVEPGGKVIRAQLSSDGRRLLVHGEDGVVCLWNVLDGSRVTDLTGDAHLRRRTLEWEDARSLARADLVHFTGQMARASTNLTQATDRETKAREAFEKAVKTFEEQTLELENARRTLTSAEQAVAASGESGRLFAGYEAAQAAVTQAAARLKSAEDGKDGSALPALKQHLEHMRSAEAQAKATFEALTAADRDALTKARTQQQEARKRVDDTTGRVATAERVRGAAEHEMNLASKARGNAELAVSAAESALAKSAANEQQAEAALRKLQQDRREGDKVAARAMTADFDTAGRIVVVGGADGSVNVWDATDGLPIDSARCGRKGVASLEVEGSQVNAWGADGKGYTWDLVPEWEWLGSLGDGSSRSPLTDRVAALTFSPDGRLLASGGGQPTRGGEVLIWDVAKRRITQTLTRVHSDQVFALAWSSDGRYLAGGGADRFVRVIEVESGKMIKNLEGHTQYVLGVAWRRDGRVLASAGADGVVKTWDFQSGERLKNLAGQDKEVTAVGFLGIRGELIAVSGDPHVRMFKEDGTELSSFEPGGEYLAAGAVDRRGRHIAAGGLDGVVRVWEVGKTVPIAVLAP